MNPELLQKYIAGNATEVEKQRVTGCHGSREAAHNRVDAGKA